MSMGAIFVPLRDPNYMSIVSRAWSIALAEASKIARIVKPVRVENLKPVHLNWSSTGYAIVTGSQTFTLLANRSVVFWGIVSNASDFDYIEWYRGENYIGEWYTLPVYFFRDKNGAFAGNIENYVFRGGETFKTNAHSTAGASTVSAWFLGFVALPETGTKSAIITT